MRRNGVFIARYAYDVLGRRIVKRVYSSASGGTVAYTRFVYRTDHVTFETDSAGTIGLRYIWGPGVDNLLALRDAGGNHFYVASDPLGNIRGLVKRDGTWVMSQRFGAYGTIIGKDSSGTGPGFFIRYGWTGRELDAETGLYFFRTRFYDPRGRRFVQEDFAAYAGSSNLYAYGDGNPFNGRDPDGINKSQLFYDWENLKARQLAYSEASNPRGFTCYIDGLAYGGGICSALVNLGGGGGFMTTAQARAALYSGSRESNCPSTLASIGNAGCAVDPRFADAVAKALVELSVFIEGVFVSDGEFLSVVRGEGSFAFNIISRARNDVADYSLRSRSVVQGQFVLELNPAMVPDMANTACYYGTLIITGGGIFQVGGAVDRDLNSGVFYRVPNPNPMAVCP